MKHQLEGMGQTVIIEEAPHRFAPSRALVALTALKEVVQIWSFTASDPTIVMGCLSCTASAASSSRTMSTVRRWSLARTQSTQIVRSWVRLKIEDWKCKLLILFFWSNRINEQRRAHNYGHQEYGIPRRWHSQSHLHFTGKDGAQVEFHCQWYAGKLSNFCKIRNTRCYWKMCFTINFKLIGQICQRQMQLQITITLLCDYRKWINIWTDKLATFGCLAKAFLCTTVITHKKTDIGKQQQIDI